jgi:2-dehydropantoate 2-reductase
MQITIIGAGAIGGSTGAFLTAAGHDVMLVDNMAEHVEAMNRDGLRISGVRGDRVFRVNACMPDQLKGPLGVVMIAVKAQHTEAALRTVMPLMTPDDFIISMQNGLNEESIAAAIGAERTLGCLVHYGADFQEPGHIQLGNEHEIYFGELDGRITPRLRMITDVMSAVMPSTPTDNIWGWKWTKLIYGSLYFAGALLDIPQYEALQRNEYRQVFGAVVTEGVKVAYALGHKRLEAYRAFVPARFAEGYTAEADAVFASLAVRDPSSVKVFTGIQRDLMVRKRKTEVDQQPGVVVAKAELVGIAVPYHREIIRQIKELEDGKRTMGWHNIEELAAAGLNGGDLG